MTFLFSSCQKKTKKKPDRQFSTFYDALWWKLAYIFFRNEYTAWSCSPSVLLCFVFFYEEELMRTLWIVAEVAPPVSFRLALSVLNNCLSIYAAAANSKSWSVIGPCNIISWPRSATAYNISRLCVLTVNGKKVTKSNETEIILTDRIST